MKVNIAKGRAFVMVWAKGNVDLYLKASGNYDTAYHDLVDEDQRILRGLKNHLESKKNSRDYAGLAKGINEVIQAIDKIYEERRA